MDLELERFKTDIDLRIYAAGQGYAVDRSKSWAGSCVMRNPSTDDKIIISRQKRDGHWVYYSVRDDSDNGTVIDFIKHRLGLSLGATRKELRTFVGLPAALMASYPPMPTVTRDRIRVERAYGRTEVAHGHPYLERERCIQRSVIEGARFIGQVRIDSRGNAVFPHRDRDGICGLELKNCGFTGFSAGGVKGLWMSNTEPNDSRLVVCESAIDALSHAVLCPDNRTRYISLAGKPTPLQKELLSEAIATMPASSSIVSGMDNDDAGREMAEVVRAAVKLTCRSDLHFEIHEPAGYKDWNDGLRLRHIGPLPCRPEEPSVA